MNVPFVSSGAFAQQYALVRRVESSESSEEADAMLRSEIKMIKTRLARPTSLKQIFECLVILLYCHHSMTSTLGPSELDFALPHALTLAEAGTSLSTQRLGFLFCATFLPGQHELHLMLVNTLRKHLESDSLGRIALALDYLIQKPGHDLAVAVQTRLRRLLAHPSNTIRHKALYAARALGQVDSSLLRSLTPDITKRVRDTDTAVARAAVTVCKDLQDQGLLDQQGKTQIYKTLLHYSKATIVPSVALTLQRILCFYVNKRTPPTLDVLKIVQNLMQDQPIRSKAIIIDCYKVIEVADIQDVLDIFTTNALVSPLRPYILSGETVDQVFFLACFSCLDPQLWAGTAVERHMSLDAFEVERIVQLIGSPDSMIRLQTARMLVRIDADIVRSRFEHRLEEHKSQPDIENVIFLIELALILAVDDGALWGQLLGRIFATSMHTMISSAIGLVLSTMRAQSQLFAKDATKTVLDAFKAIESEADPTFVVITCSLATEFGEFTSESSTSLLQHMARCLHLYPVSLQEVLLLAMVYLASQCGPQVGVADEVRKVQGRSKRYIRQRCEQFMRLMSDTEQLRAVINRAQTRSLPDISASVQLWFASSAPATANADHSHPKTTSRLEASSPKVQGEKGETLLSTHHMSSLNLITLDSPFLAEPQPRAIPEQTFSQLWQNLATWPARGWREESGQDIVKMLETLGGNVSMAREELLSTDLDVVLENVPDLPGILVIKLIEKQGVAGSLWQLKSDSKPLQLAVRALLDD